MRATSLCARNSRESKRNPRGNLLHAHETAFWPDFGPRSHHLIPHLLLVRLLKKRAHGQQDSGADDAGIGDVEGGPGVEGREAEIEAEEIDDVAVEEGAVEELAGGMLAEKAVREIAKDAADEQGDGEATHPAGECPFTVKHDDEGQRSERDEGEGVVRIRRAVEHAKGHAGVRGMMQPEDAGDDLPLDAIARRIKRRGKIRDDPALRDLVGNEQREGEEQEQAEHRENGKVAIRTLDFAAERRRSRGGWRSGECRLLIFEG